MFILHLLPDTFLLLIINSILLLGFIGTAAAFLIKYIPPLTQYKTPLQILSIIILVAGVYFKGGYSVEVDWREKVAEVERKLAIAEEASHHETVRIETQVVEKIKVVKEKVYETKNIIKEHETIINAECRVPDVARVLYNSAVNNEVPTSTRELNGKRTDTNTINGK